MAFIDRYHSGVENGQYRADQHQTPIVQALHDLHAKLCLGQTQRTSLFARLISPGKNKNLPNRGLYIWGGVGRGKTWLMDEFLKELPMLRVRRFHFHEFMQAVHSALTRLTRHRDPLTLVPRELFAGVELICIDEFQVTDITDAMILHGLLAALFKQRITLIITSNLAPDQLYKNGLQRDRFLPAIGLIQASMQVLHLQGEQDYRGIHQQHSAQLFIATSKTHAESRLSAAYKALTHGHWGSHTTLSIAGRAVHCVRHHATAVWFEFDALCATARATSDYIHLAKRYKHIFISFIPVLSEYDEDKAKRLHNLIDELYDHHCYLYAGLAAEPQRLYQGRLIPLEFQRTASRLQEMSSAEYLHGAHLGNRNAGKHFAL